MGRTRFEQLAGMLPPGVTITGIDEHTALVLDLVAGNGQVMGRGGVSVLRGGEETRFKHGRKLPLSELGPFHQPRGQVELPAGVQELARTAQPPVPPAAALCPPPEVVLLAEQRDTARTLQDWAAADALRRQIAALGWRVLDTQAGPQLEWAQKGVE